MNFASSRLLIAWYGDDFTGAAAVMEVLAFAKIPTMLFLEFPSPEQLARFPDLKAIGIASTARTWSPQEMDAALPNAFRSLKALNAEITHYKICSTLDSSPETGSIGRAIEIGAKIWAPEMVPVLVAAPQMRRYQVFGQLFAGHGDHVYRLDQHPVMANHPVTPMTQPDVALHISAQSNQVQAAARSLEHDVDNDAFSSPAQFGKIQVRTIDCIDETTEARAGRMLWRNRNENPFVVGSQGIEYALIRHWRDTGQLGQSTPPKSVGNAQGMVIVSGSVSATTGAQIKWARSNGFACIRFDASKVCETQDTLFLEIKRVVNDALKVLSDGQAPLIFSAQGPDDAAVAALAKAAADFGLYMGEVNKRIGQALGEVLTSVLARSGVRRAVISGGDTSGFVTQKLGIFALSALAPTIPGASLYLAHSDGPMDGLELALKGGQMGSLDYFGWIRDGGGTR
ncbi:four-carbon acid sugar kinase family protein [Shimia sp. NS0008-38b]|uniref:four-carbon acid sugar kinase family protein n=1 Tax=Shimia sp. NS0008-38b TaxID=3127653 RepID=UPI00310414CF